MENPQSFDLATSLLIGLSAGMLTGGFGIIIKAILSWRRIPAAFALVAAIAVGALTGIGVTSIPRQHTAAMVVSAGLMGALVPWATTLRVFRDEPESGHE